MGWYTVKQILLDENTQPGEMRKYLRGGADPMRSVAVALSHIEQRDQPITRNVKSRVAYWAKLARVKNPLTQSQ